MLRSPLFNPPCGMLIPWAVPSQAEIRLKLTANESNNRLHSGSISWLVAGINAEDAQWVPAL